MKWQANSSILRRSALALVLFAPAGAVQASDFTLQQVLSAPFPSDLTPSPAGGRIAWVFNNQGARNVWVGEKQQDGSLRGRAVTLYAGDDGMDLGELSWAPSGTRIVYTRGGDLDGGPPVNPTSAVSGPAEQTVWSVDTAGGAPRRIGAGNMPSVSPKGDRVAYLSGGQIFVAPLEGGAGPDQVMHDRGTDSSLVWSPDGGSLAFVSTRSGRSLVGVLDLASRKIAWMSPGVDSDMAPEWSPDATHIAFVRLPAGQGVEDFTEHRVGQPWSILVCDARTGDGRTIWTAAAGPGSVFHGTISPRFLMWSSGDKIIFPWERTGWLHLYTVQAAGGTASELTSGGDFEVFNTVMNASRDRVVYSANAGDIDRWHLWEVRLGGGAPHRLTGGEGIEDYPLITSDGTVAAVHGDARTPIRPVEITGSGQMIDIAPAAIPADFPSQHLVQPQTVIFAAADGLSIHGQLFLPPKNHEKRGPALLFFHGGPVRQMLPAWHPMDAYSFMYGFNQYLANEGYVVLSVNYRGGIGYGLDFREAKNFGAAGASELNDILGGAAFLRARSDVDPGRLGIWGGSYGGLMTALGLARAPDLFAAGVDYAGVHDWRIELPQFKGAAADLAFESSALSTVDRWRAPVLVAHNDDDRDVPFAESIELVEALRKQGVPFEQLVMPDEVHVMLRAESWRRFFAVSDEFLNRYLKPGPAH